MWDVDSGKELHRFIGHSGSIHQLSLSKDAKRFVSSSADGSVKVWDLSAVIGKLDGTPLDHPSSTHFHPPRTVVMGFHAVVAGGKSFAFDLPFAGLFLGYKNNGSPNENARLVGTSSSSPFVLFRQYQLARRIFLLIVILRLCLCLPF
jgi:WD40 repeat protein